MRLTEADYAQLIAKRQPAKAARAPKASKSHRANKFNAVKTGGCDSGKEYDQLQGLRLMQKAGLIHDLISQVTFLLIPAQVGPSGKKERSVTYTADFIYVKEGRLIIHETKSDATKRVRDWPMRRKMVLEKFGVEVCET